MIHLIEEVNAKKFHSEFKKRKSKLSHTECVLLRDLDFYKYNCSHCYLATFDQSAGVAVEKDGRIVSVFSDGTHPGIGPSLIEVAVKAGGKKLECNFMKKLLIGVYFKCGFIPVVSAPLDKNDIYWNELNDESKYPKSDKTGNATIIMYCIYNNELNQLMKNDYFKSRIKPNLENVISCDNEFLAEYTRDFILDNIGDNKEYINSIVGIDLMHKFL